MGFSCCSFNADLLVKIECRGYAVLAQGVPAGDAQIIIDDALIFKLDLLLCRMDIDIDLVGSNFQKEDIKRELVIRKNILISRLDGMLEIRTPDISLIDK